MSKSLDALDRIFGEMDDLLSAKQESTGKDYAETVWDPSSYVSTDTDHVDVCPRAYNPPPTRFSLVFSDGNVSRSLPVQWEPGEADGTVHNANEISYTPANTRIVVAIRGGNEEYRMHANLTVQAGDTLYYRVGDIVWVTNGP